MEDELICLDSNILIEYFRKRNKEQTFFYHLADSYQNFAITSITEFEIRCGVTNEQSDFWDQLLTHFLILSFDSESSRIAAKIDQGLKKQSRQISKPDLFIASIAIRNNLKLATLNQDHFNRISELSLLEVE